MSRATKSDRAIELGTIFPKKGAGPMSMKANAIIIFPTMDTMVGNLTLLQTCENLEIGSKNKSVGPLAKLYFHSFPL